MKHLPFQSNYRADYEVVEERQGNTRLYPHTQQLPVILRALRHEFYGGLPARIARADHRATAFDKLVLRSAAVLFCNSFNGAREDELRLYSVFDKHFISKPAILQQITEDSPRGRSHRFRFYVGKDLFIENFLCGRRVIFADHVLERFSSRTENFLGEDLTRFLITFFDNVILAMPVGPGRAFVISYHDSILALPYRVVGDEYFVTTCLTINEITSLEMEFPPHSINVHYQRPYIRPAIRNWLPVQWLVKYNNAWERKTPPNAPSKRGQKQELKFNWHRGAHLIADVRKDEGHGPGSRLAFMDNLPGPVCIEALPDRPFIHYDEIHECQKLDPSQDWEWLIAERVEEGTFAPPIFPTQQLSQLHGAIND